MILIIVTKIIWLKHEIIKDLNYVEKGKVIDLKEGRRVFRFEFDLEASNKWKYM